LRGVRGWGRVGEKITLYPDSSGEAMHVLLLHAGSAFTICRDLLYLIACFVAIWACCHYKYLWGQWKVFLLVNLLVYLFVYFTRRTLPIYDIFTLFTFSVLVVPLMYVWSKIRRFAFLKIEYLIMFLLPLLISSTFMVIHWHIALYHFEPQG